MENLVLDGERENICISPIVDVIDRPSQDRPFQQWHQVSWRPVKLKKLAFAAWARGPCAIQSSLR
jgi:hypothetical protein